MDHDLGLVRIPRRLRGYVRSRANEIARATTRATCEPLAQWALRRIRLDGKPFRFEQHEYLRSIYDDTAPHIVLCKGAQIGGTSWAVLKSLHACAMGLNTVYLFPTRSDVQDFSRTRVAPLLAENPFLSRLVKETDTIGLKRVGDAYLYLRGMQSSVGLKSVPADMLVFDELDEASPDAKALAKERLAHSDYKRLVELSNPSLPGYGIDAAYQLSDQRHWTLKCPACGHWTALDKEFPTTLGQEVRILRERDDGTVYRACLGCAAELDLDRGEWVAAFPDRKVHGYRISQLISAKVDAAEILQDYRTTRFPERFYNMKIGIAWADTQNRLTAEEVLGCCGEHGLAPLDRRLSERCTMGVDTGKDLHVVVSRWEDDNQRSRRQVVWLGTVGEYAELDRLMERFNVGRCVIDALPEIHATRAFAQRHPGRVFLNYFVESQRGGYAWDTKEWIVRENRTEALDASRQVIRAREVVLPRGGPVLQEFASHLAADVKRLEEDEETGARCYRYVKTGTNHFSFAFTYDCIAWSRESSGGARCFVGRRGAPRRYDPIMDMQT